MRGGRALAIVAQDPVLFRGPIRTSLDPLGLNTDEELLAALEAVRMCGSK